MYFIRPEIKTLNFFQLHSFKDFRDFLMIFYENISIYRYIIFHDILFCSKFDFYNYVYFSIFYNNKFLFYYFSQTL